MGQARRLQRAKKKKVKDKNGEERPPSTPSGLTATNGYAPGVVEVIASPIQHTTSNSPVDSKSEAGDDTELNTRTCGGGPGRQSNEAVEERIWQAVLDSQRQQHCGTLLAGNEGQGVADSVTDDELIGELMTRYRRLQEQSQRTETEAKLSVIRELLEVFDELEQADAEIGEDSRATRLIFSVTRKFEAKLQGLGLQRIDALGRSFDERLHRASGKVPREGFGSKVVVEELESGWVLGTDVVRQALVAMG